MIFVGMPVLCLALYVLSLTITNVPAFWGHDFSKK